ncbi:MAG: M20/M25/M40 family metallo-hydrolase [Bryobacteraceae bacterium]|jgi:acetylornithine deacetylase
MEVLALTRKLVDIESTTGNEADAGACVLQLLQKLASQYGGVAEQIEVAPERFNVLARFGEPAVTLSTHLDTVPPFIPLREDETHIWGRGACDAKGIAAAMICAAESLLAGGVRDFALLFVVGEEKDSAGAYHAGRHPIGSRYLINGEPTGNRLALGSKGALRYELAASGRMAHSAYPELGESAIEKLLDALARVRRIPLPRDETLGPCTLNIGLISGGRAPNVIPDAALAALMFRLVGDPDPIRAAVERAAAPDAVANELLCIPALRLGAVAGFETTVVSYTTDIPAFGGQWGEPYLIGPGSIHVAHTGEERVPKAELVEAVEVYARLVRQLLADGAK